MLAAGGANFPEKAPWKGGAKAFHTAIYRLDGGAWTKVGDLPSPRAYAAYAAMAKGMVVAGGVDSEKHLAETLLVTADGKTFALAPLPRPVAYAAFAVDNNRLYVIGGQESPTATAALAATYRLDLTKVDPAKPEAAQWETLPGAPFGGRILSIAGALDGKIQVFGGCSLAAGPDGKPARIYHTDGATLIASASEPAQLWASEKPAPLPGNLAAAAMPAPAREGILLVIGGDDGSRYGQPPQEHPGQSNKILAYDPRANAWTPRGDWPEKIATAPALIAGDTLMTVSGETRPGIRTPAVAAMEIGYVLRLVPMDWLIFVLCAIAVGVIVWQARTKGVSRVMADLASASGKPSRAAWIAVGLLFAVAMLNYLDRQLLATMRPPIVRDIPQTDAQFGLLTAIFLFIYSALSPVGGIFADRFSRRLVILVSLVVWSVVTWITGHVRSYEELVAARALMGVSEACYIPAALALITDFHRGPTRSLATGIHMSGIYLGQALAGLGGFVAEAAGWRLTFGVFGLVGVAYALVLILFLKEPGGGHADTAESGAQASAPAERPGLGEILSGVLHVPAFWLLMAIMACASTANWFVLSWLPLLLQEKFNLSLGVAGIAHVGGNCVEDAKALALKAEELGLDGISALAPSYYKPGDLGALIDCCAAIAAAAPKTPFYYYDIPVLTGVNLPMHQFLAEAPARIPTFAGIKFTNPDLVSYRRTLDVAGDGFDVPWGVDETILAALATGAKGGVGSTYNWAPKLYTDLIAAFERGDLAEARRLQSLSIAMIDAIASIGFLGAAKKLMTHLGVPVGPARLPLGNPTQEQFDALLAKLNALGFQDWGAKAV